MSETSTTTAADDGSAMAERITVDRDLCDGYGNCVFVAPDVFDLDDDNRVVLLTTEVPAHLREDVQTAVAECPMRAIVVSATPDDLMHRP